MANVMFTYYDRNNDKVLEEVDLVDIEQRDHLERLSQFCSLTDMLSFDDKDEDGKVTLTEFYRAFSKYSCIKGHVHGQFNTWSVKLYTGIL